MEFRSLSSRLFVTVMTSRWKSQFLTSLSQDLAPLAHFGGEIAVILRTKHARFAYFKKVICFVFNDFLASFPRFSYFPAALRIPPTGRFRLPTPLPFEGSAETCDVLESSNSVRSARISALNCGSF
jgi:hypothetical protein